MSVPRSVRFILRLVLVAIAAGVSFYGAMFAVSTALFAGFGGFESTRDLLQAAIVFCLSIVGPASLWRLCFLHSVVIRELWLIALVVGGWGAMFLIVVHLWA